MIPPFAVSFSSSLRTRTRSCRGVIFIVISLTSIQFIAALEQTTVFWLPANATDEKSSDSSLVLLRGLSFLFLDDSLLFAALSVCRVSRLRRWQVMLLHSFAWYRSRAGYYR